MISSRPSLEIKNSSDFEDACFRTFQYQFKHNAIYKKFAEQTEKTHPSDLFEIPFLPISFFKSHTVTTQKQPFQLCFESSGTTQNQTSKHYIHSLDLYQKAARLSFEKQYGPIEDYTILALLPSYLERQNSSLVYMVQYFMNLSNKEENRFYLDDFQLLYKNLIDLSSKQYPTLLIGVSFALLDFVESHSIDFPNLIVMETGGMKGRKKEMIREELHALLKKPFGVSSIHSEYGMTELLSQFYAPEKGIFHQNPWAKILIRDATDPFSYMPKGKGGAINVIDLANYYSCSFIATDDLGISHGDTFEVRGRLDNSDIRGCNLLVSS